MDKAPSRESSKYTYLRYPDYGLDISNLQVDT